MTVIVEDRMVVSKPAEVLVLGRLPVIENAPDGTLTFRQLWKASDPVTFAAVAAVLAVVAAAAAYFPARHAAAVNPTQALRQ